MLKSTDVGASAYLIMPSHAKSKTSYSRCRVDLRTGKLKLSNRNITHVQTGTAYEMDNILYRRCAQDNFDVIRRINTIPSSSCNLTTIVTSWLRALPADTNNVWLHYGGDVFYMSELVCLIQAAERNSDKTIYLQSGRTHLLNILQGQLDTGTVTVPSNFILGAELQCHTVLPLHNFPSVLYSNNSDSLNEFCNFPRRSYTSIGWNISPVCQERLATRRPGVSAETYIKIEL